MYFLGILSSQAAQVDGGLAIMKSPAAGWGGCERMSSSNSWPREFGEPARAGDLTCRRKGLTAPLHAPTHSCGTAPEFHRLRRVWPYSVVRALYVGLSESSSCLTCWVGLPVLRQRDSEQD